jgi:hypothetical protein
MKKESFQCQFLNAVAGTTLGDRLQCEGTNAKRNTAAIIKTVLIKQRLKG